MTLRESILDRLFSLEGKSVLITGASGGIGSALAEAMGRAGAAVGVHGLTPGKVEEACRRVGESGRRGVPFVAGLEDVEACRALVAGAARALGRLDVLINCVGINRRKPIAEATEDDFNALVAVNLRSVYFLCQAAQPIMREQGGGKIINIGSMTSLVGLGGVSVYGLTKAAVGQLTRTQALEWARDNIQVNCLAPGFMMTPLTEKGLWGDSRRRRWLLDRIPMRRPGNPDELVGAALLLASPASSYLTGQVIAVDGGFLAGGYWESDADAD